MIFQNKKDKIVHYMVTKEPNSKPRMKLVVGVIYAYVQNKEVYFKYEPRFHDGVLIFGIVGYKKLQKDFQKMVGGDLKKLGCKLDISTGGKGA